MKSSFYTTYSTRSLTRGGQRTVLALFCIAVGVMAIVGLQLASGSLLKALTGNVRALNQGDVSVRSETTALRQSDLAYFDQLRQQGVIIGYTPETQIRSLVQTPDGKRRLLVTQVVDPNTFPLVGAPHMVKPRGATIKSLLATPGTAVLTQSLADGYKVPIGGQFTVHPQGASAAQLTLAGIVANDNANARGDVIFTSIDSWQQATGSPVTYTFFGVTTRTPAEAGAAATDLRRQFPLATVQTTDDVTKDNKKQVELIRKSVIIVGLLALLIGGVGIVNTMQVLLARRRIEIAVLKTSGYRRRDLYLLFGIEAALLGLVGGVLGALLGVGVSDLLRRLFQRATQLTLPANIDPLPILSGVGIGLATALIFGLLPIVRAAAARPQAVLRDMPEGRSAGSRLQTLGLVLLLSVLFCVLASIILKSVIWGIAAVYGAFIFLGLLSLGLSGILWLLERLPIPERYSLRYLLLVTAGMIVALAIAAVPSLRGVGILIVAFALLGYLVVLLPRAWKVNGKLALRNIGRTRGRTTTTLLALFIGVFAVGLVLVLGQNLRQNISKAFASQNQFNLIAGVSLTDAPKFDAALKGVKGVQKQRFSDYSVSQPLTIGGKPAADRVPQGQNGPNRSAQESLGRLAGVQGYSLANGDLPVVDSISAGRNLTAADAGTGNVILDDVVHGAPLRLNPGDQIVLTNPQSNRNAPVTVVGFYKSGSGINLNVGPIFGSQELALQLAGDNPRRVYFMKVGEKQVADVQTQLQTALPQVFVFNFGDIAALISSILNNIVIAFSAIAALALIAGVLIVANAVALAMLERRRELGVLKALGYNSQRLLSGVLLENGLTAGLGGLPGMVMVAITVALFAVLINTDLTVGAPISILIIGGVVALVALTALAVAWQAVRVRPLEVLRYE